MSANSNSAGQASTKEIEEATKELTATTAQIEAETKKLQAEMAKLKAQFPAGSTKPLPGETTVDDKFGYVAHVAACDALTNAAADIAQHVRVALGSTQCVILMVDSLDFATGEVNLIQLSLQMTSLGAAMKQQTEINNCRVELVAERLRKMAGKPPEPLPAEAKVFESLSVAAAAGVLTNALTIAPGLLSAAADIFGYFQTTDTFKSVEVTMNAAALRAAVAGALRHKPDNTPSMEHSVIMADYHVLKEGDRNQGTPGIMALIARLPGGARGSQCEHGRPQGAP